MNETTNVDAIHNLVTLLLKDMTVSTRPFYKQRRNGYLVLSLREPVQKFPGLESGGGFAGSLACVSSSLRELTTHSPKGSQQSTVLNQQWVGVLSCYLLANIHSHWTFQCCQFGGYGAASHIVFL